MDKQKYINKKEEVKLMKRFSLMFMIISLFMVSSAMATTQPLILMHYAFEEGSGNIALDTSGSGNHGVVNGGAWSGGESIFGDYAMTFDGNDDNVVSISQRDTPDKLSVAFWIDRDTQTGNVTFFEVADAANTEHFHLRYNADTSQTLFEYVDELGGHPDFVLDSVALVVGTDTHLALSYDYATGDFLYWRDAVLKVNTTLSPKLNNSVDLETLYIGSKSDLTEDYDGTIDEFYITDYMFNTSIVNTLKTTNALIVPKIIDDTIDLPLFPATIILSTSPENNTNISNFVNFDGVLTGAATCNVYLDNKNIYTSVNDLAFSFDKFVDVGAHDYFVYCYYDADGVRYYDITDTLSFNTESSSKPIDFFVLDQQDSKVFAENLYITTPCLRELAKTFSNNDIQGDRKAYIKPLVNGNAAFNLTIGNTYEFCLVRGQINTYDDFLSSKFDIVSVGNQIQLGNYFIENGTQNIVFSLSEDELYSVYEPEFWGKTIQDLFLLVVGLIIGGFVIYLGIVNGSEKLIFIGAIIIATSAGISISAYIFGVL